MPDAAWICGDALDPALLNSLGTFDIAISNPPFGNVQNMYSGIYTSNVFEYMIIEAASHIAKEGRARRFEKQAGITLDFNVGIDTSNHKD